jgi:hypothetical protein
VVAVEIIRQAAKLGVRLAVFDGIIKASPPNVLPPELKAAIREHEPEVRALLLTTRGTRSERLTLPGADPATWIRTVTPNSRAPLIPDAIREKIAAIEPIARNLGWPPELLWNANFWDAPRGLAAVLDADDEIVEVTADYISILKIKRDLLKFRRTAA